GSNEAPLEAAPEQTPALRALRLADEAHQNEDYAAAVRLYQEAQQHAPQNPAPLVGLVQARLGAWQIPTEYAGAVDEPRLEALLALLKRAEQRDRAFAPLHLQRGRLWLMRGEPQAARSALRIGGEG